jgi:hypothetical protein
MAQSDCSNSQSLAYNSRHQDADRCRNTHYHGRPFVNQCSDRRRRGHHATWRDCLARLLLPAQLETSPTQRGNGGWSRLPRNWRHGNADWPHDRRRWSRRRRDAARGDWRHDSREPGEEVPPVTAVRQCGFPRVLLPFVNRRYDVVCLGLSKDAQRRRAGERMAKTNERSAPNQLPLKRSTWTYPGFVER